jgi:uncharacterized cofD-like protein
MKKIVTIGGGTGQFALLSALRDFDVDLTAVVAMADSGGSTGRLRDEYGVLPPGDALKCLIALSPYRDARQILQNRFTIDDKLKGHNAGNLLLVFLAQYLGHDFGGAIDALGEILQIKGRVLPSTLDKATLAAELENGEYLYGETVIDNIRHEARSPIKRVFLVPHAGAATIHREAREAIDAADFIIIGPGDLYTSLLPNLLVAGMNDALIKSRAPLVYLVNIMTKCGESDGFAAADFVGKIEQYLPRPLDLIVENEKYPSASVLEKYRAEKANAVAPWKSNLNHSGKILTADLLADGEFARHDIEKLHHLFQKIIS